MEDKVRFAVVGHGHIGRKHAELIREADRAELVAVCDTRPGTSPDLKGLDVPVFQGLEDMLREGPDMEVVNICTPNNSHAPQALKVLEAGLHAVIEKPMALSRKDCEAILHKALQVSKKVFCVMQNRYSPVIQWVKALLEEGRLGQLHLLQINCFWNRDDRYYFPGGKRHPWHGSMEADGGVLFTQFAHFIDILYWLVGDIDGIKARGRNLAHGHSTEFDDSGAVLFDLAGGGLGTLTYTTAVWDRNFESSILLIGSEGTVKIGGQYMNRLDHCHIRGPLSIPDFESPEANQYMGYQGSASNHSEVIANVIDAIRGKGAATTNALEGMKVVEIIERIYMASR